MLETVEDLLPKYLDIDLVSQSAAALRGLCPIQLAVYDLRGRALFLPPNGDAVALCPASVGADAGLSHVAERVRESRDCMVETLESGVTALVASVTLEEGCVGLLAGFLPPEAPSGPTSAQLQPLLEAYARLLAESVNGRRSSADLSSELLERYEELSMVYALSEAMDISKPQDEALDIVFRVAADTLGGDVLLLDVPGFRLERAYPKEAAQSGSWKALTSVLASRISSDEPIVTVNNVAEDPSLGPLLKDFAHLASAHVDVGGDPGMLVMLRRSPEHRFYMGDVKMLESIAQQMSMFLSNCKAIASRQQLFDSMIFGLARLAESRDPETGDHLERVTTYCRMLAAYLSQCPKYHARINDDFIGVIGRSSPLHDIGKVGIPDGVLLKPGKLTEEEFEIIKTHTTIGGDTLRDIEARLDWGESTFLTVGREIAYGHHEKWNGRGYPEGLAGEDIPLAARIMALADVYDALTSKRCYKEGFSHEKARAIITEEHGQHFDPDVVEAFLAHEGEFDDVRASGSSV